MGNVECERMCVLFQGEIFEYIEMDEMTSIHSHSKKNPVSRHAEKLKQRKISSHFNHITRIVLSFYRFRYTRCDIGSNHFTYHFLCIPFSQRSEFL